MGSVNNPNALASKLQKTFELRKEQHAYKAGMETSDKPEDEKIEKTLFVKARRELKYGEVVKVIDVVKGSGASPIVLQLDDLP
jgi:biopolymer transport protein ExbD